MKNFSWVRAILSVIFGLVIAVIVAGVVNLMIPVPDLALALIPICLSSLLSAFAGYLLGARQKHKNGSGASS
jgi:heme A synthase